MDNVQVALTDVRAVKQRAEKTNIALLLTLIDEAVNEDLMDDPGFVVHVLLVGMSLFRHQLLNYLLHLAQRCEL